MDHNLKAYANMKSNFKGYDKRGNSKDGTHEDHNFASLGEAAVLKTMDATMDDLMMGTSKAGICVSMVTHT